MASSSTGSIRTGSTARRAQRAGLDGKLVLSSVGRLFWIKNQQALVRAFAAGAPADAVLLLAGGGDEAAVLRWLVAELGQEGRVHVLGNRGDVPEILAASDLYVHPAIAESFGMVLLEAMSMGLPVVSAPVGIAPDVIRDGKTGVLADRPSAGRLSRALRQALAMREDWPAMGAAARRRATAFPADAMIRAHEELYERCLSA